MAIKKIKSLLRLSKSRKYSKSRQNSKLRQNSKSRQNYKSRKHYKSRKNSKTRKNSKIRKNSKTRKHSKSRKHSTQKGGFINDPDCNLATIKEPGFNLEGSGDIPGISIPESRAIIYNPNCQVDSYQAMTPN